MELNGSKTRENLNNAFNAEARTNILYRLYADRARQEGDYTAGQLFDKTARNELAHAALWYGLLHPGCPDTQENLQAAVESERFETTRMYNLYAETARAEGFPDIARLFDLVASTECTHEQAYAKRRAEIDNGEAHRRAQPVDWICQDCGHHQPGSAAPDRCPVCGHGRGYFLAVEN